MMTSARGKASVALATRGGKPRLFDWDATVGVYRGRAP